MVKTVKVTQFPPGSDNAVAVGCKCPRMDNSYGKGYYMQPGVFVISEDCLVHSAKPKQCPSSNHDKSDV